MDLEKELSECNERREKISKKRGRLIIFDKLATSAGVMSVCALPISPIALIPLGASIGLALYVNKQDVETFNDMSEINYRCHELESEIIYNKRVKKIEKSL